MKIRITAKGIYGAPVTDDNPSGEYPIGHEIDLGKNEAPAGWVGRYQEVGGKAHKDSELVTNDENEQPRRGRPTAN